MVFTVKRKKMKGETFGMFEFPKSFTRKKKKKGKKK